MITMVNNKDASKKRLYDNFFANMSMLLRNHDAQGKEVPFGSSQAALPGDFETIKVDAEDYQPGMYYVADGTGYKLATEDFDTSETYYTAPTNDITSLDELFEHIADIAALNPNYTRLPLDEPLFEIDLNSRTIKVPTEFQKNGVGIQGDHIAESIYFSCPRFFDATDLGNDLYKIFIQWENAAGEQRVSIPTIRDIESKPGYIIFDWPICDKLTSKVGTAKMAIRFYRIDNGDVVYSLSTQPASISIKAGLNFENFEEYVIDSSKVDDHSGTIIQRFVNSPTLDIEVEVEDPVFTTDLVSAFVLDLKETSNNKVSVSATGDGILSYAWRKKFLTPRGTEGEKHGYTLKELRELYPLQDNPTITDYGRNEDEKGGDFDFSFKGVVETVPTEDASYVSGKDYYVKNDRGLYIYVEDKNQFDELKASGKELLEKQVYATLNGVGEYYVEASNRKKTTVKTKESNHLIVEYPEKPEFTGSKGFEWNKKDQYPDSHACVISSNHSNHTVIAKAPIQRGGAQGSLVTEWYKAELNNMNFSLTDENPTTCFSKIMIEDDKSFQGDTYAIETPGYYRALVTNHLNGEKDSITSGIIRATKPAKTPKLNILEKAVGADTDEASDTYIYVGQTITIEVDPTSIESESERISDEESEAAQFFGLDTITYQWYKYIGGQAGADNLLIKDGAFVVTNDNATIQPNEVSASFKPQNSASYFCVVKNTYNGNTALTVSEIISVIGN